MERMCLEVTFNVKGKDIVEYAEKIKISLTGYVAVYHFDGGYNCIHTKEELKTVRMVQKQSLFNNMEEYLAWKNNLSY